MSETATGGPIEVWRGVFAPSEADSEGRVELHALIAGALEGLAAAAAALGMHGAFAPFSSATLIVRELQARVVQPSAPGAPMHMTCGVLDLSDTEAQLVLTVLDTATEALAALFLVRVAHASAREGRPFPWPQRTAGEADALKVVGPAVASEPLPGPPDGVSLIVSARGAVRPQDGDAFGRMRLDALVRRLTGALTLLAPGSADLGLELSELRLECRTPLVVGDLFELISSVPAVHEGRLGAIHWLRHPISGAVLAAAGTAWRLRGG